MIYLNHAGTTWPKPSAVGRAVQDALTTPASDWATQLDGQQREVCRVFGVADPHCLLLTPGATSALAVAIADHAWMPGDRILISSWEHHAVHRPVQQLARQGVEVVVLPPGDGEALALGALEDQLRRGRVRLIATTAACNVTGTRLPTQEIIHLARRHGALSLIDAAQIAGWEPLDLDALGADLLVFTGHKGPHAPWGVGALYVRPGVSMASPRAACELPQGSNRIPCASLPAGCDVGSIDRLALAGLVAGLRWLAQPAQEDRLQRARQQALHLETSLRQLPGVSVWGRARAEHDMPTLAVTVQGHTPLQLAQRLVERHIHAAAGQQCAPLAHETLGTLPDGVLRLSFGPMNHPDDAAAAAAAVRDIVLA